MPMRYRILCDSCCDFSETEKRSAGFEKIPAVITISSTRLTDDKQFRQAALLGALETQSLELKLDYPAESDYLRAFDCGAEELYVVTASSSMGEHYAIASRARREFLQAHPAVQIHVFNARSVGAGELLVARKISHMLCSGCSFRQVVQHVERYLLEIGTYFLTGTASALPETGLLGGKRTRAAQSMQQVLCADLQGKLVPLGGALTEKLAERKLLRRLLKRAQPPGKSCLLAHCGCPERAHRLAQQLRRENLFQEVLLLETGGVGTLMLGRGGIILAYGPEKAPER